MQTITKRVRSFRRSLRFLILSAVVWASSSASSAYSVVTHQAIIDLAWNDSIRPLLLSRFPRTTEEELLVAHAYAYGGCAIQDAGYYPFGNRFFSDLTHYVRTGDFVTSLFRNARDVNEYAFAVGALSHYVGDAIGHRDAINPATAIEYPKLAQKYGGTVTYEDASHPYVATEFSFDVDQTSRNRFAPDAYLRYVGLLVSRGLLERAFYETYGSELTRVLGRTTGAAIKSYRSSIRSFIPVFVKSEVVLHRGDFPRGDEAQSFALLRQHLEDVPYSPDWLSAYRAPGFGAHVLAVVIRILPPIGAISYLKIRGPNTRTEQMYFRSLERTIVIYDRRLDHLRLLPAMPLYLANRDLDTGDWTTPGAYALTDQTYARLLHMITRRPGIVIPRDLKQDILDYYSVPDAPITTKRNHRKWAEVQADLAKLKQD